MNSRTKDMLIKKLESLPPERLAEVEDFVDFLCSRDKDRSATRSATKIAEPAFTRVWDNKDDDAYDEL